jgi:hypothetical protein
MLRDPEEEYLRVAKELQKAIQEFDQALGDQTRSLILGMNSRCYC